MAKNIIIQEGGVGKQLAADKLKTNLVGGGTCLWVPEDEVILGTKSIIHNGTYSASADGLTGFSQVNVNVQGDSVTGRDPVTGQEKTVTVDPETGDLVETVVPSAIRVIAPPTNPYGTYIDGQTITKDGMVVKAYLATGEEYGTVPIGEITINPTVAVYDSEKDRHAQYKSTSGLETAMKQPIVSIGGDIQYINISANLLAVYHFCTEASASFYNHGGVLSGIVASSTTTVLTTFSEVYDARTGDLISRSQDIVHQGTAYTHDGKTVYYYNANPNERANPPINELNSGATTGTPDDAWTMIYGTREITPAGSPQTITVSWPRPGDGKLLETTFDINVGPRAGQGDD